MPMISGVFGVVSFAAVKISGYAGFSSILNRILDRNTPIWKFGAVRAILGLLAGLLCFAVMSATGLGASSSAGKIYLAMFPLRLATWALVLRMFYGAREWTALLTVAVIAGVIWSYLLDLIGALLLSIPGMQIGFC